MLTKEMKLGITETLAILKLASQDEINKIPQKFMDFLNENADNQYKFEIDYTVSFKNLKIRKETKNILGIIAYNFWSDTPEKKANFEKILKNNQKIYEEKLKEKYNLDNLFNNKEKITQNENEITEIVEYKENIVKKIYNFLYKIFKRN